MASTAALDLVISLKAEGAESGLKTMASHVSALGTAVGTFAGGAALAGVRALGGAITGFLGDAIQESRDAAHGLAQTEAVIKSTGGAAKCDSRADRGHGGRPQSLHALYRRCHPGG
jgi:hypothetical protein